MIRLGVDAINLAADRRGMGRLVRQSLRTLHAWQDAEVVLVVRDARQAAALRREVDHRIIFERDVAAQRFDAVWFPWNGIRFAPRAPAIVTVHDPFAFTYPHPNFIARFREQSPIIRAVKLADAIFTPSEWTAKELRRLFRIETRVQVVPNAVDEMWYPVSTAPHEPYILFVAGPEVRKNAEMLFRIYDATFQGSGPQLVVVGNLSESAERTLARVRGTRRHVFPTDEELRELYSGALFIAIPSLAEGYGLPAVEAMACGAPVLASNAAALPEACDGAAVLVPSDDENAWRSALRALSLDERHRMQLRELGLARVARIDREGPAKALLASARQLREAGR